VGVSPVGPFHQWPTGSGFEHFYGFVGGEANQHYPGLYEGTTAVEPPNSPEAGYRFLRSGTRIPLLSYATRYSTAIPIVE